MLADGAVAVVLDPVSSSVRFSGMRSMPPLLAAVLGSLSANFRLCSGCDIPTDIDVTNSNAVMYSV